VRLKEYKRNKFERKYTNKDILLLAKTAELHDYRKRGFSKKDPGANGQYIWEKRMLNLPRFTGQQDKTIIKQLEVQII